MKKIILYVTPSKRPFLRRTKSTRAPQEPTEADLETTTAKLSTKRGSFKTRKTYSSSENAVKRRPYLNTTGARSERPLTRNFTRRRFGGANATSSTSSTTTANHSSTSPPTSPASPTRRFRVASRRRLPSTTPLTTLLTTPSTTLLNAPSTTLSTTTTTTTELPTTFLSEEELHEIEDTDFIDSPALEEQSATVKTPKIQRRPLLLNNDDQNPSATNEEQRKKDSKISTSEEKKRQSKKYSSKIKQNQLEEVLKKAQSQETFDITTEGKLTTVEDFSAETALAIAAHQLLSAPLPVAQTYNDDEEPKKKSPYTTQQYQYTSPFTEQYTSTRTFADYSSTPLPNYQSTIAQDFVQTTSPADYSFSPIYEIPRATTYEAPKMSSYPSTSYTSRGSSKPSTVTTTFYPVSSNSISSTIGSFKDPDFSTSSQGTDYSSRNLDYPRGTEFSTGPTRSSDYTRDYSTTYVNDFPRGRSTYLNVSPLSSTTVRSHEDDYSDSHIDLEFPRGRQTYSSLKGSSTLRPTLADVTPAVVQSITRHLGREKLIPVPVEDYSLAPETYSSVSQEPAYFTREYLLESPVTKTYDDEYQYLSPVTTPSPPPQTTTVRILPKKELYRKISTTIKPTEEPVVHITSPKPKRIPQKKPFEKVKTHKPILDYDYYEDGDTKFASKYGEETKVVLHGRGTIECLDIGNFPHPSSCKKFISCARLENGSLLGWEYICPKGLSFDPVGGICNWSAGLGCDEKAVS